MRYLLALLLLLLLPVLASADPQPYMKKDDPNQIYMFAAVRAACPISKVDLVEQIEGILVRSRIKPMPEITGLLFLSVTLDCQELLPKNKSYIWFFSADFVGGAALVDGTKYPARYGTENDYSFLGRGDADSARRQIRRVMEVLVTDYLKANFDLGDDDE